MKTKEEWAREAYAGAVYKADLEYVQRIQRDALESAAQAAKNFIGGYTASLTDDCLIPDEDGPWCLNSDVATAILALIPSVTGGVKV